MINNEWERFGDEIRKTIQNAVDSRDFSRLNQTISDTLNQAADNFSRGMRNGGWYKDRPMRESSSYSEASGPQYTGSAPGGAAPRRAAAPQRQPMQPASKRPFYLKGTSTKVGGIFLAVTGYLFAFASLIFFIFICVGALATGWDLVMRVGVGMFFLLMVIFLVMGGIGTGMVCSVGRFRKYVKMIQNREYCDIKELSAKSGRSVKAVVKDLKKMIKKGWFCQGHLDEKGTCLMVSDAAWNQYQELMERMHREKVEKEAAEEKARKEYESLSPEVQKIVRAGDEYVRKIREANDAIPGEEISAKISRMEMVVDRIFDRVEQNPETIDDIRRLMEYYLPTTIKLLEAYEELDSQPVQGENIISSKKEIEKTLDTLNAAFEKLLDDLFQDTAWDVSSDISVLHTMLAQEGLTDDGLKSKKK